jgi:hypothetical protein
MRSLRIFADQVLPHVRDIWGVYSLNSQCLLTAEADNAWEPRHVSFVPVSDIMRCPNYSGRPA